MTNEQAARAASQAVTFAREKTFERDALVLQHDILREALRRGQDATTPAHIEEALRAQQDRGNLLPLHS